jgi:hypothetical protein
LSDEEYPWSRFNCDFKSTRCGWETPNTIKYYSYGTNPLFNDACTRLNDEPVGIQLVSQSYGQPTTLKADLNGNISLPNESGCMHFAFYSLSSIPTLTLKVGINSHSMDKKKQLLNVHNAFNEDRWIQARIDIPARTHQLFLTAQLAYLHVRNIDFRAGACESNDQLCTFEPSSSCSLLIQPFANGFRITSAKTERFLNQLPEQDATFNLDSGHYLTSQSNAHQSTDLQSQTIYGPKLDADTDYTIRFRLYRPTEDRELLQLLADPLDLSSDASPSDISPKLVWTSDAEQSESHRNHALNWLPITIPVRFEQPHQLLLRVQPSGNRPLPFALDDFSVDQQTLDIGSCNFASDLCGYHHGAESTRLFIRSYGRLTNPQMVHEYAPPHKLVEGRPYLYLDYTNADAQTTNVYTDLWSARLNATSAHCLRIQYNLQGNHYGSFNFWISKNGDPNQILFKVAKGDSSHEWNQAAMTVSSQSSFNLVFGAKLLHNKYRVPFFALGQIDYVEGACEEAISALNSVGESSNCAFKNDLCTWNSIDTLKPKSLESSLKFGLPFKDAHAGQSSFIRFGAISSI